MLLSVIFQFQYTYQYNSLDRGHMFTTLILLSSYHSLPGIKHIWFIHFITQSNISNEDQTLCLTKIWKRNINLWELSWPEKLKIYLIWFEINMKWYDLRYLNYSMHIYIEYNVLTKMFSFYKEPHTTLLIRCILHYRHLTYINYVTPYIYCNSII